MCRITHPARRGLERRTSSLRHGAGRAPAGLGIASRWVFPGRQDGHAALEVLAGRFIYAVAVTEANARLALTTLIGGGVSALDRRRIE